MKIIFVRPYAGEMEIVRAQLPEHEFVACESIDDVSAEVLATAEVLSVFVNYQVTEDVLARLPALRFIATRSAGFDHIDIAATNARNVVVSRVPHYGTRTVAEFAVSLMFALSRKSYMAYLDMQQQSTIGALDKYEGFDLAGKILGVVGTGAIGCNVAQIARGLGMNVLAYDVKENPDLVADGVRYAPIEEVLAQADIVTLHLPSLPATYHFLNRERLALLKPTAYLINTSRGEIVDTIALVEALHAGQIAGAGLDVLESEHDLRDEVTLLGDNETEAEIWKSIVADHALIDMPNVIVTPHIAFNTKEAKREITDITCANILAYTNGSPQNLVL